MRFSTLQREWLRAFFITTIPVAIFSCFKLLLPTGKKDWDFETYYAAGRALNAHLDPYVTPNLQAVGSQFPLGFVYPPYLLPVVGLFGLLPHDVALAIHFTLEFAALWCMVGVWRRCFVSPNHDVLLTAMLVAGLGFSAWTTWLGANIAYIELTLIWIALAFYIRRSYHLFAAILILASLCKLLPLIFLGLLLATRHPRKYHILFGYSLVVLLLLGACKLISPQYTQEWLANAFNANQEVGRSNPSSLAFFTALFPNPPLPWVGKIAYGLWSVSIATFTVVFLRKRSQLVSSPDIPFVLFAVLAFCLIVPRLKDYTLIVAVPALLFFSTAPATWKLPLWTLAFVPMAGTYLCDAPGIPFVSLRFSYHWPQVVFFCFWLCGARLLPQLTETPAPSQTAAETT